MLVLLHGLAEGLDVEGNHVDDLSGGLHGDALELAHTVLKQHLLETVSAGPQLPPGLLFSDSEV